MKVHLYNTIKKKAIRNEFYLRFNNWDDYGFKTLFYLIYHDNDGYAHRIGAVKIGSVGMKNENYKTSPESIVELPESFSELGKTYFSIGQDKSYYKRINDLGEDVRIFIHKALNDVCFDLNLFENFKDEAVMRASLMRDMVSSSILGEYNRLANGREELTEYKFSYYFPRESDELPPKPPVDFHVVPYSNPPSNIQILIGRNGVGKTYLINSMIDSLLNQNHIDSINGYFSYESPQNLLFANLVSVTFSAFDDRNQPIAESVAFNGLKYSYIGLKGVDSQGNEIIKSTIDLKTELIESLKVIIRSDKVHRLRAALITLSADPIFKEMNLVETIDAYTLVSWHVEDGIIADLSNKLNDEFSAIFNRLSSGHRIVLLTVTKLVETVVEKSIVFFDEPEIHLHPPLLSSFIRVLSDLLSEQNGVALIATHSPVVLQEVPKKCAWRIDRIGNNLSAERLIQETFGENVGILTRDVFGLEVTDSGFYQILFKAIDSRLSYEEVFLKLDGELGLEAQGIIRAAMNNRELQ